MTTGITVASATDTGLCRSRNEDAVVGACWPSADGHVLMLAVADGMGGTVGGAVASALAIGAAERFLREQHSSGAITRQDDWFDAVTGAFAGAVDALREHAEGTPDLRRMGTTLTCLIVDRGRIMTGHVGDSRAYLFRAHQLRRLTGDHNAAAQLVSDGRLTPSEARSHKSRFILTRWLAPDGESSEAPDMGALAAESGDVVLVCSDGLHGMVSDEDIAALLDRLPLDDVSDLNAAAKALIARANEQGGRDNISVAIGAWPRS